MTAALSMSWAGLSRPFRFWGRKLSQFVMPGLVPGTHAFLSSRSEGKAWMAGTGPAMTASAVTSSR
jgi:hypothetical protein